MEILLGYYNYWIIFLLMMVGLYAVMVKPNLVKKLMGLVIFQVSVLLFYITISNVEGGAVPIYTAGVSLYHNPLPHVLMLTAIVVGVSSLALGLAIVVRISENYGTIEEPEILKKEAEGNKK